MTAGVAFASYVPVLAGLCLGYTLLVSLFLAMREESVALQRKDLGPVTCKGSSVAMTTYNGKDSPEYGRRAEQEKSRHVYVYERNPKTGSTSWIRMIRRQAQLGHKDTFQVIPCHSDKVLNSLAVSRYQIKDENKNSILTCHLRRAVFARRSDVRLISSFFVEKDMVQSKYLQMRGLNLSFHESNYDALRKSSDYADFVENYKIDWQLDYMGYSSYKDPAYNALVTCPITSEMQQVVDIAVEDTYLPISHDLPCISRKLLREMVGLDIQTTLMRNVRAGGDEPVKLEPRISCIDVAMARAMTVKIIRLFDGRDLSMSSAWREEARRAEEQCVSDKALLAH